MSEPFRIEPHLPVHMYRTFAMRSPRRRATCMEVDCQAFLQGWKTIVPADSAAAHYIRHDSGRGYTEERTPDGLAMFTFHPGQTCFAAHKHGLPAEGEERFAEWRGDWRGRLSEPVRHSPQGFTDAFGENQERLKELIERG